MLKLTQFCKDFALKNVRLIQTTAKLEIFENKWRVKNGLTKNPNTESPLTYLPDFSYMDGRPAPIGHNMKRRLRNQRKYAKQIIQGIYEIDYAEKRYIRMQEEEKNKKQEIIKNKFIPKGAELLKSK